MEKKTVLITGATSGIGAGCARRFAKEGWRVIITGRNKERLNALTAELEGQRHTCAAAALRCARQEGGNRGRERTAAGMESHRRAGQQCRTGARS